MRKTRAELVAEKEGHLEKARAIAARAKDAGRPLSDHEQGQITALVDTAKSAHNQLLEMDGDDDLRRQLNSAMSGGFGGPGKATAPGSGPWGTALKSSVGRYGLKDGLTPSGAITVPSLLGGIVLSPDRPLSLLAVIPTMDLSGTDSFAYLLEITREHAASAVAAGQIKPESNYELEKKDGTVTTVAHLSPAVDRSLLMDVGLLSGYLDTTLRAGVSLEVERLVLDGDESLPSPKKEFDGVATVANTQAVAFNSTPLQTARDAVVLAEETNIDLAGWRWVMSPAQWAELESLTSDQFYVMGGPGSSSAALPTARSRRQLWGIDVIVTSVMDEGHAWLGDWAGGSCKLYQREAVRVDWSEASVVTVGSDQVSAFQVNQVQFRAEARVGFSVDRPRAFIDVDLAAGS